MKYKKCNVDLERAVLTLPEFLNKGWLVQDSTDYSVTLTKNKNDKTEKVTVYSSYLVNL